MKISTGWIAALIMFVVILYLQMCQGKPAEVVPKADYTALAEEKLKDSLAYLMRHNDDSVKVNEAHIAAIQQNENAVMFQREMNRGAGDHQSANR